MKDIKLNATIYIKECLKIGKTPFVEEFCFYNEIEKVDLEVKSMIEEAQKVMLLKQCSPEFLLSVKHGMNKDQIIILKGSGLEEKDKIGIKITPGSQIVKLLKTLREEHEKNTNSV